MSRWKRIVRGRSLDVPFASGHSGRYQNAFTLIEVLLVLAIMGIMMTVMLPQVMSSLREHALRGATRTVISANRHAMSLAVLSQRRMTVVYDLDAATLTIRAAARANQQEEGLETPDVPSLAEAASEADRTESGAYEGAVAIVDEEVVHQFDNVGFRFIEVEGDDGYRAEEGQHTIIFYTNGRCTPHTVGLVDEDGGDATIEIDALCSAQVVRE